MNDQSMVLILSREVAGHLAVAIARHVRESRRSGLQIPDGVLQLAETAAKSAMSGQERTEFDPSAFIVDHDPVPRLLLTITETAMALACSERTVRRLVSAGQLLPVRVGHGSVRIRASDLSTYTQSLNGEVQCP